MHGNCNCRPENPHNCIALVPIFNSLTQDERQEIAAITTARTFKKGRCTAGDRGQALRLHAAGLDFRLQRKEQVIRVPGGDYGELSSLAVALTDRGRGGNHDGVIKEKLKS